MTRRLVPVAVFFALILPATASAKEPVKAVVCGGNGCATSEDRAAILPLVEGGPPAATPPAVGAPAYRVRLTISVEPEPGAKRARTDTFTTWMSPALGLIRGSEGTWMTLPAPTLAALRRVAGDIRPFPAARLPLGARLAQPERGASPSPSDATARTPAPAASEGANWTLVGGIAGGVLAALAGAGLAVARRRRSDPPTRAAPVS